MTIKLYYSYIKTIFYINLTLILILHCQLLKYIVILMHINQYPLGDYIDISLDHNSW